MVIRKYRMKLNESKFTYSITQLKYLRYLICNGEIKLDPERLQPFIQLPAPTTLRSLKRAVDLFSYYSCWIPHYPVKFRPLLDVNKFPLNDLQLQRFQQLKGKIAEALIASIDEDRNSFNLLRSKLMLKANPYPQYYHTQKTR
ncbi:hypothetical protein GJ496_002111 [Pomphorhynchus laevis]|nr:hypothetical protein GJ496_002111 [Pomphorhynchus laevis]